jgi:hypothetical protein
LISNFPHRAGYWRDEGAIGAPRANSLVLDVLTISVELTKIKKSHTRKIRSGRRFARIRKYRWLFLPGGQIGCDYQGPGNWVFGVQGSLSAYTLNGETEFSNGANDFTLKANKRPAFDVLHRDAGAVEEGKQLERPKIALALEERIQSQLRPARAC